MANVTHSHAATDAVLVVEALEALPKDALIALGRSLATNPEAVLVAARSVYANRFPVATATKMDAIVENGSTPATAPTSDAHIADGTYTVVMGPESDYVTLKIDTKTKGNLAGSRIISHLTGPDNELDFTGFAFLSDDGRALRWKRFFGIAVIDRAMAAFEVLAAHESHTEFQEAYAMKSGRCARCGRKLTVPASLHRGVGPECATKI